MSVTQNCRYTYRGSRLPAQIYTRSTQWLNISISFSTVGPIVFGWRDRRKPFLAYLMERRNECVSEKTLHKIQNLSTDYERAARSQTKEIAK